jgi:hypothetical protein
MVQMKLSMAQQQMFCKGTVTGIKISIFYHKNSSPRDLEKYIMLQNIAISKLKTLLLSATVTLTSGIK